MRKLYYDARPIHTDATGMNPLIAWLSEHIGPKNPHSNISGRGWLLSNDFNRFARRMTKFWVEFDDWVTEEQLVAFRLTWPEV